jgi:inhibitor of cysteine peptidase
MPARPYFSMMLELTQADNGKSVEARPGDLIIIRLPENPTTGFRWTVDKMDSLRVEAQGSSFSVARDAAVGGGGERTFSFKVKGEGGAGNIGLQLRRPWEGDASVVERYGVTVNVRNT